MDSTPLPPTNDPGPPTGSAAADGGSGATDATDASDRGSNDPTDRERDRRRRAGRTAAAPGPTPGHRGRRPHRRLLRHRRRRPDLQELPRTSRPPAESRPPGPAPRTPAASTAPPSAPPPPRNPTSSPTRAWPVARAQDGHLHAAVRQGEGAGRAVPAGRQPPRRGRDHRARRRRDLRDLRRHEAVVEPAEHRGLRDLRRRLPPLHRRGRQPDLPVARAEHQGGGAVRARVGQRARHPQRPHRRRGVLERRPTGSGDVHHGDDPYFAGSEIYPGISDQVNSLIAFYHPLDGSMQYQDQYYGGPESSLDPAVAKRWDLADSLSHADQSTGPALFMTGANDWDIQITQMAEFVQAMQAIPQQAAIIVVPGGGHGFDQGDGYRLSRLGESSATAVLNFLNKAFPQGHQTLDAELAR